MGSVINCQNSKFSSWHSSQVLSDSAYHYIRMFGPQLLTEYFPCGKYDDNPRLYLPSRIKICYRRFTLM